MEIPVKVLVVAKEHSLRSMVSCFLALLYPEVREAADLSGVWRVLSSGFLPEIIVAGYERPGAEEEALFRSMRNLQALRRVPILVMAPVDCMDRRMEWRKAGATCWIERPFSSKELLEIMGMVVFNNADKRSVDELAVD
ncbi:MAG TPA: hypothetical protein DDW94_05735 [Deltaproteobacteria bacterium]|nr:MAG: hypothetical protein A2Z79_04215 [Deltaproteobacteria bacterium GWA2_55_82]OGQ64131.1 MAG: hypothetical protein A3I81_10595 [Deltaproteobacteria bacterium RIFCSPLOWO2_02_FULL_55_12]OIJ74583.1 MAG: hypothetical protein A2V21_310120 [Deltaproteobacteria bacterium GWC2_55_46]HBG46475.1 hypothetical protein [Deltaproteobacteria bacterium]HCY10687.1 hypothetical protein [Deltaproteobacteria bacterium]